MHTLSMAEKNVLRGLEQLGMQVEAMISTIQLIEESDDPDVIDAYLDILQVIDDNVIKMGRAAGMPEDRLTSEPIREAVRNGTGDFIKIRDKCIKFGLV